MWIVVDSYNTLVLGSQKGLLVRSRDDVSQDYISARNDTRGKRNVKIVQPAVYLDSLR
jgi:hypothetical protein